MTLNKSDLVVIPRWEKDSPKIVWMVWSFTTIIHRMTEIMGACNSIKSLMISFWLFGNLAVTSRLLEKSLGVGPALVKIFWQHQMRYRDAVMRVKDESFPFVYLFSWRDHILWLFSAVTNLLAKKKKSPCKTENNVCGKGQQSTVSWVSKYDNQAHVN